MPLVIELHGRGSNAFEQEQLSQMSAKADEEGFVVVYPQALGAPPTWHARGGLQAVADVTFLRDLTDFLEERMSIDPARIYTSGFSNGGGMANRLGCDLASRYAAIASVSGAYVLDGTCRAARPLPVVAFHGTSDEIVPYTGDSVLPPIENWAAGWASRNGCGPVPTVTHQQGDATGRTWQSCDMDATVTLYSIEGGGHIWPGSSLVQLFDQGSQGIVATDVIWDFFEAHPLP